MPSTEPTAFTLVSQLRARIQMLESSGAELARSCDTWRRRALSAEYERDELATKAELADMREAEIETTVDQSAEIRRLHRLVELLESRLAESEARLASALGNHSGDLFGTAASAIREARKHGVWPRRYVP